MKRKSVLIAATISSIVFTFAACGKESNDSDSFNSSKVTSEESSALDSVELNESSYPDVDSDVDSNVDVDALMEGFESTDRDGKLDIIRNLQERNNNDKINQSEINTLNEMQLIFTNEYNEIIKANTIDTTKKDIDKKKIKEAKKNLKSLKDLIQNEAGITCDVDVANKYKSDIQSLINKYENILKKSETTTTTTKATEKEPDPEPVSQETQPPKTQPTQTQPPETTTKKKKTTTQPPQTQTPKTTTTKKKTTTQPPQTQPSNPSGDYYYWGSRTLTFTLDNGSQITVTVPDDIKMTNNSFYIDVMEDGSWIAGDQYNNYWTSYGEHGNINDFDW